MNMPARDGFGIIDMDAVVFAVGNAKQAAHYYSTAFGMRRTAYRGPETGCPDEAAYVLESGRARFVFRGPTRAGTGLGRLVADHGDGVMDLALQVSSADDAYDYAVSHGALGLEPPGGLEHAHPGLGGQQFDERGIQPVDRPRAGSGHVVHRYHRSFRIDRQFA